MGASASRGRAHGVLLVALIAGSLAGTSAYADRVQPSDRVTSFVAVRKGGSTSTEIVDKLPPGTSAQLVATKGAWRKIKLNSGAVGFVSSSWTLVVPDGTSQVTTSTSTTDERFTYRRVGTVADIPTTRPEKGQYRVHVIDVGTGLSILVQGHDFNFLFDGGSNDKAEKPDRVLAYLFAAVGPSGGKDCVPDGDAWTVPKETKTLNQVVLSHPHNDHGSELARILSCYKVENVWDSGKVNDTDFYQGFIEAVAEETGATYHTALEPPADRKVPFVKNKPVTIPTSVTWTQFAELDRVGLDDKASFTVLNAKSDAADPNEDSIVLLVDLAGTKLLLVGDAVAGDRGSPGDTPKRTEKHLLDAHKDLLDADILQVGHHGSLTSSRKEFLDAVSPSLVIVSSGPAKYNTVTLPDKDVLAALKATGAKLLETYEHDGACPDSDPVGPNKGPGGCDNYVIDVKPQ